MAVLTMLMVYTMLGLVWSDGYFDMAEEEYPNYVAEGPQATGVVYFIPYTEELALEAAVLRRKKKKAMM